MKSIILISLCFCFVFGAEETTSEKIDITTESKVEIYTALFWPPCKEAKKLLHSRGIEFTSHLITLSRSNMKALSARTGGEISVPQIIVDDKYYGDLVILRKYFKNKIV